MAIRIRNIEELQNVPRNDQGQLLLDGADLSEITLENYNFSNANLRNAKFIGATLTNVNFDNANLEGADFRRINEENETVIEHSSFRGTILVNTKFRGIEIKDCNFSGANLENADIRTINDNFATTIENTNFSNANFSNARLGGFNCDNCIFENANFVNAKFRSPTFCSYATRIINSIFTNADMTNAILTSIEGNGNIFDNANMNGVIYRCVSEGLESCSFKNTNLQNAILFCFYLNCDFTDANMSNANLRNGVFTGSNFENANLDNIIIDNTALEDTILEDLPGATTEDDQVAMPEEEEENIQEMADDVEDGAEIEAPQQIPTLIPIQPRNPYPNAPAYEVHNVAARINKPALIKILQENTTFTNFDVIKYLDTSIRNFIKDNLFDKTLEDPLNQNQKVDTIKLLEKLKKLLDRINLSEYKKDEKFIRDKSLVGSAIDFVFKQPDNKFTSIYIYQFITSSYSAYDSDDGTGISCVPGIVERIYLSLRDTIQLYCGTICQPPYSSILEVMTTTIDKNKFAQEWQNNTMQNLDEYRVMTPTKRKENFITYLQKRYMDILGRELTSAENTEINTYATQMAYVFDNNEEPAFGGGGRRNRKNKRKGIFKKSTKKMIVKRRRTRRKNKNKK